MTTGPYEFIEHGSEELKNLRYDVMSNRNIIGQVFWSHYRHQWEFNSTPKTPPLSAIELQFLAASVAGLKDPENG